MSRCMLVVFVGLIAVQGSVRAQGQAGPPVKTAVGQLRFTLDPNQKPPVARTATPVPESSGSTITRLQDRLAAEMESRAARDADWNCGMPVVTPPATLDPGFERKPADTGTTFYIRRAAHPACGR